MKILQIANKVPLPARDGGSIASQRLSTGLSSSGHQLTLLAMNTTKHFIDKDLWQPLASKFKINLIPVKVKTDIKPTTALINLLFSRLPYTAVRFTSSTFKKTLEEVLKLQKYDLIIIENLYPFVYLSTIKKLSQAPIVMRAHNVENEIWDRTAEVSFGLKRVYLRILARRIKRFEEKLINQYDYLATISSRDQEAFRKMGNTKPAFTLPTGIVLNESCSESKTDHSLQIAHLGALDWAPNQEGILWFLKEVWPIIIKKYPDGQFHLAGRNAPGWFEKRIKESGVNYHGEVKSAHDFICRFPIHIVPLWSGSGMRIKIIEAMARKRVIVTTSIGVEGIEAQNNKDLIIEDRAEDFAQSILSLVENPEKIQSISKNAFTFVCENFENNKLVADLIQFIQNHENCP